MDLGVAGAVVVHLLMAKPWLADGLDARELAVVQALEAVARHHEGLAVRIIAKPFLRSVDDVDVFLLAEFKAELEGYPLPVARNVADAINVLANESWVADGIDERERTILERLKGPQGEFTLFYWRAEFVSAVSALIGEPWVRDGLVEHELALLEVFAGHSWPPVSTTYIKALVDEPWVRDGLNEDEHFLLHLKTSRLSTEDVHAFVHFVSTLADETWMQDGLDENERFLLNEVVPRRHVFSEGNGASMVQFINALAVEPWLQDGLSTDERVAAVNPSPWWDNSYQIREVLHTRLRTIDALLVRTLVP